MDSWILICQSQCFDIKKAFDESETILWPQMDEIEVEDVVYFYVTNPYRAILYKCIVNEKKIHYLDDITKDCVLHPSFYSVDQSYMKLNLLENYPENKITDVSLKEAGVKNLQMSVKLSNEVLEAICGQKKTQVEEQEEIKAPKKKKFPIWIAVLLMCIVVGIILLIITAKTPSRRTLTEEDLTVEFGGPSSVEEGTDYRFTTDIITELEIKERNEDAEYLMCMDISALKPNIDYIKTNRGIHFGDTVEEVFDAYWEVEKISSDYSFFESELHGKNDNGKAQDFNYYVTYYMEKDYERYYMHIYFDSNDEVYAIVYCNYNHMFFSDFE